jgi:ribonuclease T1
MPTPAMERITLNRIAQKEPAVSVSRLTSVLLLVLLVGALLFWNRHAAPPPSMVSQGNVTLPAAVNCPAARTNLPTFMPPEACVTLALIMQGGPFPYSQDGVVFGNYEGLLPQQPRGYYHEYTVETPGARNRATRRIITGGTPPQVFYYTGDHYRSFQPFQVNR